MIAKLVTWPWMRAAAMASGLSPSTNPTMRLTVWIRRYLTEGGHMGPIHDALYQQSIHRVLRHNASRAMRGTAAPTSGHCCIINNRSILHYKCNGNQSCLRHRAEPPSARGRRGRVCECERDTDISTSIRAARPCKKWAKSFRWQATILSVDRR